MGWLIDQIRTMFEDLESLFVEGRAVVRQQPNKAAQKPPAPGAPRSASPPSNPRVVRSSLPDWMQPAPSENPRKALPMEVVAALMAIGLASPPAKDQLRRRIRRALADAHPDRHPTERHAEMARRLHEIQSAREVLRRHGFA